MPTPRPLSTSTPTSSKPATVTQLMSLATSSVRAGSRRSKTPQESRRPPPVRLDPANPRQVGRSRRRCRPSHRSLPSTQPVGTGPTAGLAKPMSTICTSSSEASLKRRAYQNLEPRWRIGRAATELSSAHHTTELTGAALASRSDASDWPQPWCRVQDLERPPVHSDASATLS